MGPTAFEYSMFSERKSKGLEIPDFIDVDTTANSDRYGHLRTSKAGCINVNDKENNDPNQYRISLNRRKAKKERVVKKPSAESRTHVAKPNEMHSPARVQANTTGGLVQKLQAAERAREGPTPPLAEALGSHASYLERCKSSENRRGVSKLAPLAPLRASAVMDGC